MEVRLHAHTGNQVVTEGVNLGGEEVPVPWCSTQGGYGGAAAHRVGLEGQLHMHTDQIGGGGCSGCCACKCTEEMCLFRRTACSVACADLVWAWHLHGIWGGCSAGNQKVGWVDGAAKKPGVNSLKGPF
eukprot:366175-Chlamydomonas_euryale.AAC.11